MNIITASALSAMLLATTANVGAHGVLTPRGAEIEGAFVTPISSKTDRPGDVFTVSVKHAPDKSAVPLGSLITGHIVSVVRATPRHGGRMVLSLDELKESRASLRLKIISLVSGGDLVTVSAPSSLASTNHGDIVVKKGALLRLKALEEIVLPSPARPAYSGEEGTPTPHWRPSAYTDELI